MSYQAVEHVLAHSTSRLAARLVEVVLARHADADGRTAWPAVATIAREANLSERAVREALASLRQDGLIVDVGESRRRTRIYDVGPAVYPPRPTAEGADGAGVQTAQGADGAGSESPKTDLDGADGAGGRVQTAPLEGADGAAEAVLKRSGEAVPTGAGVPSRSQGRASRRRRDGGHPSSGNLADRLAAEVLQVLGGAVDGITDDDESRRADRNPPRPHELARLIASSGASREQALAAAWETRRIVQVDDRAPRIGSLYAKKLGDTLTEAAAA